MKNTFSIFAFLLAFIIGCQSNHKSNVGNLATWDDLGRSFVYSINSADQEKVDALYISKEEFAATFATDELDNLYKTIKNEFSKSTQVLFKELSDIQFVRMNTKFCPEAIVTKPGMNFGIASFIVETQAADNIRVIVLEDGMEREIKLDALVKIDNEWRLLSPVNIL